LGRLGGWLGFGVCGWLAGWQALVWVDAWLASWA
jgi:hypothetical protein